MFSVPKANTSLDFGTYFESNGWHIEVEYLHKSYAHDMFDDCNAVDAMVIYKQALKGEKNYFNGVSYLLRYDFMNDHSDGKKGLATSEKLGVKSEKLMLSDYDYELKTTLYGNYLFVFRYFSVCPGRL